MLIPLDVNDRPVPGARFVVAATKRARRAICWAARVDGKVLRSIFEEVAALGLSRPIKVYGHVCSVGEMPSFRFEQVPGHVTGFDINPTED